MEKDDRQEDLRAAMQTDENEIENETEDGIEDGIEDETENEIKEETEGGTEDEIESLNLQSGRLVVPQEEQEPEKVHGRSFFMGVIAGLLVAALITSGTLLGREIYLRYQSQKETAEETKETDAQPQSVVNQRTLSKLQTIENLVQDHYYLNRVDEETLEDGVYSGLMSSLGDKYSRYFSAQELQDEQEESNGVYYGIGAYIGLDDKTSMPIVSGILEDTPAQDAGLRVNDIVYQIDGKSTYQMALEDVVKLVKGKEGTKVTLGIIRDTKHFDVEVTRAKVDRETVTDKMLTDDIGYIQISEFDSVTADQFTSCYAEIKGSNAKGLILDLRGNPGGLLSSVVSIGQQILPKGMIVYTKDKQGKEETYESDGSRQIQIPVVVLVNGGSASAAEILTGAIKDDKIGTIVGTTTFGKGIVQKMYPLSDGSAVKMTVSAYYTPSGTNIQGTGIEPDVKVELDEDAYYNSKGKEDNQLEKAKEIITQKIAGTYPE